MILTNCHPNAPKCNMNSLYSCRNSLALCFVQCLGQQLYHLQNIYCSTLNNNLLGSASKSNLESSKIKLCQQLSQLGAHCSNVYFDTV